MKSVMGDTFLHMFIVITFLTGMNFNREVVWKSRGPPKKGFVQVSLLYFTFETVVTTYSKT